MFCCKTRWRTTLVLDIYNTNQGTNTQHLYRFSKSVFSAPGYHIQKTRWMTDPMLPQLPNGMGVVVFENATNRSWRELLGGALVFDRCWLVLERRAEGGSIGQGNGNLVEERTGSCRRQPYRRRFEAHRTQWLRRPSMGEVVQTGAGAVAFLPKLDEPLAPQRHSVSRKDCEPQPIALRFHLCINGQHCRPCQRNAQGPSWCRPPTPAGPDGTRSTSSHDPEQ